jgi:hypothetical protein
LSQPATFSPRACFQLLRLSQGVVQKRAEIGLDDIEFALRDRNGLKKIVYNLRTWFDIRAPRKPIRQTRAALNI